MRRGRRCKDWLWLVGLGAVAILPMAVSWRLAHRSLLDMGTRITDAPQTVSPTSNAPVSQPGHYLWLSDHEVLCRLSHGYSDQAFRLDTRTGVKTPVAALNTAYQTVVPDGETHLSPGGKWLLYLDRSTKIWYPSN